MSTGTNDPSGSPTVLRGPRVGAWGYVISGIIAVLAGAFLVWIGLAFGLGSSGVVWSLIFAILFAALGVVLIVRSLGARIELTDDTLTLYGYLVTRRIPRSSIVGFGSNGTIEWGPGEVKRTTGVAVLGQFRPISGPPGVFQRHFANDDFDRIRAWAAADHKLAQNW